MFTELGGWFGAETRRQRSGRMPGRLSFALRLEDLEGRATPGGLAGGVFAEPTAVVSDIAVRSDSGISAAIPAFKWTRRVSPAGTVASSASAWASI
jgi:hypothetical protein